MRQGLLLAAGALLAQRGGLFHWVPVCFGTGIGLYFALGQEPGWTALWAMAAAVVLLLIVLLRSPEALRILLLAVVLLLAGVIWQTLRTGWVAGPVLGFRYYGAIEGRIVAMDRSASDAVRLTLDQVRLDRIPPDRLPQRVRLSLHGTGGAEPQPGAVVMTTGHLLPPSGPAEPGGFDFQRHAWFQRIGAVGYSSVPLVTLTPPRAAELRVFRIRMTLAEAFRRGLPGEAGAFAAAVTAGDRSGMGQEALRDLRVSNLAHLLAISGLHMGLLAGFVFMATRRCMAMSRGLALFAPVKSMAAFCALVAASGYLLLSGGSIATERAFVMVAMALIGVMALRRAISLRAVALAALVVLLLRPEALLSPGFQMSFAATLALVVVFGALRNWPFQLRGWKGRALTLLLSSAVAGLATAPVAAAQFNQIAHYGLLANLLSVPVMGTVVIPAGFLAILAMPFGLQALPMTVMGWGLDWILAVAHVVAGLKGARGMVVAPPGLVLPMLALSALFVMLWQGWLRWLGLLPLCLAFVIWGTAGRPLGLIAESGALVGILTPDGRALSRERSESFTAAIWLENDGDPASQQMAAARWSDRGRLRHATGKRAAAAQGPCTAGEILVLNVPADLAAGAQGCVVLDPDRLRVSGSLALWPDGASYRLVSAKEIAGDRPWNAPETAPPLMWQKRLRNLSQGIRQRLHRMGPGPQQAIPAEPDRLVPVPQAGTRPARAGRGRMVQ